MRLHSPATPNSRAVTTAYAPPCGRARRGRQEFLMLDVDYNEAWEYATQASTDDFALSYAAFTTTQES